MAHQVDPEARPIRPSEEEMLTRAYDRAARKQAAWEEKMRKFERVRVFLESEGE